jgi:hypothetical protein
MRCFQCFPPAFFFGDRAFATVGAKATEPTEIVYFKFYQSQIPVIEQALEVRHRAARLTPPAVATQYLLTQTFVRQGIQPQGSGFRANRSQDTFSRRFSRSAYCSFAGQRLVLA